MSECVQNNEDVKIAVSKNFEEVVLDEAKDTLLEVKIGMHSICRTLSVLSLIIFVFTCQNLLTIICFLSATDEYVNILDSLPF